jgi:hypothetical protein
MDVNITNIEDIVRKIREMGARVLIMGDPDTGKTSLIKEMLTRTNERFLVLDRSGEYRGFTDYYGIFPINPIDFVRAGTFVNVAENVLGSKNIGIRVPEEEWGIITDLLTGELDEEVMRARFPMMGGTLPPAPGAPVVTWRPIRSVPELLLYLYQYKGGSPAFASAFNNQLWTTKTHNLLYRWLMGGLGGSVGIDLSRVNERVATVYTYMLLFIIGNDPEIKINPPIVVIDWNHVLDISPVPIPSDIPPIIFTECGRVQNMDFITLLIRFQKTGMAHAEGLVESDIRVESGHIEPKPNARVFDCLDPNLPVVEYDSNKGRYVIRDFRERNAQCLIEAENVA